jgi:hypothetical protein
LSEIPPVAIVVSRSVDLDETLRVDKSDFLSEGIFASNSATLFSVAVIVEELGSRW